MIILPKLKYRVSKQICKKFCSSPSKGLENALLHGLFDAKNEDHFRTAIDLNKASTILSTEGIFWEAVKLDNGNDGVKAGESLTNIATARSAYLKSRILASRIEVLNLLQKINDTKEGEFVLYLGGKSTGKTLTLQLFAESHPNQVLYVDGRCGGKLSTLLGKAIPSNKRSLVLQLLIPALRSTNHTLIESSQMYATSTPAQVIDAYLATFPPDGPLPIIVIDEMNRFAAEAEIDANLKIELGQFIQDLVRYTKQSNRCKAILSSSEYSFPSLLNSVIRGCNVDRDVTQLIYAGEVPPKEMYQMLTKEWKMGNSLASLFISCFGGHIWNCSLALHQLCAQKENFKASSIVSSPSNVMSCLDTGRDMKKLLEKVAKDGFAPLSQERDPRAKIGCDNNVIGVVRSSPRSVFIGIPEKVIDGSDCGIVPSSQSMRLIIARALSTYKNRE